MNEEPSDHGILDRILGSTWFWLCLLTLAGGAVLIPNFIKARQSGTPISCISYLKQLDGAKEQWALENHKTPTNTPVWNEIVGANAYFKTPPRCPQGGVYQINRIDQPPVCSVGRTNEMHVLPQ